MIIVYVVGAFLLLQMLARVRDLLFMIVVSLFLSFAIEPAVNFLAQRGWRRGAATGLILFTVILLGIVMVVAMVPLLIGQIQGLVAEVPGWLDTIATQVNERFGTDISVSTAVTEAQDIENALRTYGADVAGNLLGFGAAVVTGLFQLLTILLFTFYFVADGPRVRRSVCSLLSPRRQREVLTTWEIAIDMSGAYFYSRLLLAVVNGVALYILLRVVGVPFALPLAMFSGLFSQFVPVVGTYIASVLALLVALLEDPVDALIILVFILIYQQVENYVLGPRVTKHTMQLHPAVAIGSAIAGGSLAGPLGAFLALPAAAIIQASIGTFVARHEVLESDLTSEEDHEEIKRAIRNERKTDSTPRILDRFRRSEAE
jgi:predicted PurR-regulated permease PerM